MLNGCYESLAISSKKLSLAEIKNLAMDRELLDINLAIKHFRYFIEGQWFKVRL